MTVVSGYAKGIDTATHLAAVKAGGTTVIVLAEGILRFRRKRAYAHEGFDWSRSLVVSQFPPLQTWSVGAAMSRNAVIAGLGLALVVVEAGETGGTLNAGLQALDMGRPVIALDFSSQTPPGNAILLRRGAVGARSTRELAGILTNLPEPSPSARQLQLTLPN